MLDKTKLQKDILKDLESVTMDYYNQTGEKIVMHPLAPDIMTSEINTKIDVIRSMNYFDKEINQNIKVTGLEAIVKAFSRQIIYHFQNTFALDDLTDVVINSPKEGDIISYVNGEWKNTRNTSTTTIINDDGEEEEVEQTVPAHNHGIGIVNRLAKFRDSVTGNLISSTITETPLDVSTPLNLRIGGYLEVADVEHLTTVSDRVLVHNNNRIYYQSVTELINDIVVGSHNHNDLYYLKTQLQNSGQSQVHYNNLTNVPTTFVPSNHVSTHLYGGNDAIFPAHLTGFLYNNGTGTLSWSTISVESLGLDDIFAAKVHEHSAYDITSGTLGVSRGGTGSNNFTAGYLKANGTNAFNTVTTIPWGDLSSVPSIFAPTSHPLISSHTVSGLTTGHFLKALSATTFGFAAHGLTYTDVGAQPLDATLTSLAALDSSIGFIYQTGLDTFTKYGFGGSGAATTVARSDHSHSGYEPTITSGLTTQYWRGDKTWQVLNTSIVLEATNLYYTNNRVQTFCDTRYQILDADLTSIAGLSGTTGLLRKTAANTWGLDTNPYLTGNQTITLSGIVTGSGATEITTAIADGALSIAKISGLQTALNGKQALDATLTALAGLNTTSGFVYQTGTDKFTKYGFGTAENTVCAGNDSRLSDARTPTAHGLVSASHTVSGLTTGHFLKALSATTFGFAAHGLTYTDVGAAASGHNHSGVYEPVINSGTTAQYWRGDKTWQTLDTSAVAEGTNLYYTNSRVAAYLTGAISGILTSNLTASRALVSDVSGKIVASSVTSAEQALLSGKNSVIDGSGTAGYVPYFTGAQRLANSPIYTNGTNVAIGKSSVETWSSSYKALQVGGNCSIMGTNGEYSDQATLYLNNCYLDASATWKPMVSGYASIFRNAGSYFSWQIGSSLTEDTSFTPTTIMSLSAAGILNLPSLTASRAVVTDGSKNIVSSSVTSTELALLSGKNSVIDGSGTTGYIPRFTAANRLANSPIFTNGTNVGIGIDTITQNWHSNYSFIDLRGFGSITGSINNGGYATGIGYGQMGISNNTYYNDGSYAVGTGGASSIVLTQGHIEFANAPSVAAGALQTFTSRLHITDSGKIGVNTITPEYTLTVAGDIGGNNLYVIGSISRAGNAVWDGGNLIGIRDEHKHQRLWSISHPNEYYITNTWVEILGAYRWRLSSKHSDYCSVAHADGAHRMWATSHPNEYYVRGDWDNSSYWYLRGYTAAGSFHAHCRVGYADSASAIGSVSLGTLNTNRLVKYNGSQFANSTLSDSDDTTTIRSMTVTNPASYQVRLAITGNSPQMQLYSGNNYLVIKSTETEVGGNLNMIAGTSCNLRSASIDIGSQQALYGNVGCSPAPLIVNIDTYSGKFFRVVVAANPPPNVNEFSSFAFTTSRVGSMIFVKNSTLYAIIIRGFSNRGDMGTRLLAPGSSTFAICTQTDATGSVWELFISDNVGT